MKDLGKFMVALLIQIVLIIINGFVFSKLWLWFIVPMFQMQPINLIQAIGIFTIIQFLRIGKNGEIKDISWKQLAEHFVYFIIAPMYFLLIGYVVTLFI